MKTIEDVRRAAERASNTWFGPAEMKGFGTRVSSKVYPLADLDPLDYPAGTLLEAEEATVFVTSERDDWHPENPRLYSVRLAVAGTERRESDGREVPTFDVKRVSEFGEYTTLNGAHYRAKRWVHGHPRAL